MGSEVFSDFYNKSEFFNNVNFSSEDDIFSIIDALGCAFDHNNQLQESLPSGLVFKDREESEETTSFGFEKSACSPLISGSQESETGVEASYSYSSHKCKRQKLEERQQKISHITVERNRRKQMNEHLSVLRSLMPCFYVKRGDQASIIGGVINYINELQQILRSLEAKRQRRKACNESLTPKPSPPHPSPLNPCKPPLSLQPVNPSTPQPSSPYRTRLHKQQNNYLNSTSLTSPIVLSPCNSSTSSINDSVNELVTTSKSAIAEVELKFSGPNLLLKTMSRLIPGQTGRIISALEELELDILDAKINTVDETMMNFFTVKIGIECQLSAEELAHQILRTFH